MLQPEMEAIMKNVWAGVGFVIFLVSSVAYGRSADYVCTIEKEPSAFQLKRSDQEFAGDLHVGQKFTVQRTTGIMDGALKNAFTNQPNVVDPGSRDDAFKVITTEPMATGGVNIFVLVIKEYEKTPTKDFIFINVDALYTGVCEYYFL